MADPRSSDGDEGGTRAPEFDPPEATFRLAFGVYVGALLAAVATTAAALGGASALVLLGVYSSTFALGVLVGWLIERRRPGLAGRLGRSRRRRLALVVPSVPFGAAALVAYLSATLGTWFADAALVSAFGVLAAGHVLSRLAENRYADAVAGDDPIAAWRWEPPGSPALDVVFVVLNAVLGLGNAYDGNRTSAILWTGLGLFWVVGAVLEGRWAVGDPESPPELRVQEAGLVKRRPNARSFVPWSEITGARLTVEELVLERRLFDLHFDRDELEDPEAVRDGIDRVRSSAAERTDSRGAAAGS